jgi:biopolymer transport protein ExbD
MRLARIHRTKLEINMTPMIDVTFLLLIFFMTVNQMSRQNKEPIPLPTAKGTQDQSEGSLTINIGLDGGMIVSARPVSMSELVGLVSKVLAEANNQPENVTIVVRAHRDGSCRGVNDVIRTLNKLDITRVRLAVESNP